MLIKIFKNKEFYSEDGFTLIEVLIAIVILSFIALYAYQMIDQNLDTKEKISSDDKDYMQTLTAMNRIETDFNEFYSPLFSSGKLAPTTQSNDPYQDPSSQSMNALFEGATKSGVPIPKVSQEEKGSFTFLSTANRRKIAESKESNFVWIKYSVKSTEDQEIRKQGGLSLVRQTISTNPFRDSLNWSDVKEQVILSNLKEFEFQFWDERSKKFVTTLSDLNENKNMLRLIKVNFTWINQDNNEFKFQKIFRVITPYFNTKQDDLKAGNTSGAWQDGQIPQGLPNPNSNPNSGSALPEGAIQ